MRNDNFHNEWRTIDNHRIFLTCRDGFPHEGYWEMAKEIVDRMVDYCEARLVTIFADEGHGSTAFTVVTDNEEKLEELKNAVSEGTVRSDGHSFVEVHLVKPSPQRYGEHYNHTRYLYESYARA